MPILQQYNQNAELIQNAPTILHASKRNVRILARDLHVERMLNAEVEITVPHAPAGEATKATPILTVLNVSIMVLVIYEW